MIHDVLVLNHGISKSHTNSFILNLLSQNALCQIPVSEILYQDSSTFTSSQFHNLCLFWDHQPCGTVQLPTQKESKCCWLLPPQPKFFKPFTCVLPPHPIQTISPNIFSRTLIMCLDPFRKKFSNKKSSLRNNNYFFHLRLTCRLPKTLEILDLSQNSFGDDGLEEFSRHLPPRCAAGSDSWFSGFRRFFFHRDASFFFSRVDDITRRMSRCECGHF